MPASPTGEETSEVVEETITTETETTQDDNSSAAESSAAGDEGGKSESSLLDRVTDALKPEAQTGETPDQQVSQEEGAEGEKAEDTVEGAEADDLEDDPTDEELAKYHSKTRRRVKKLIDQRNTERDAHAQTKEELHGFYGALRDAGVTQDGLNTFVEFSKLTYTDPAKALQVITPIIENLRQQAGEVLPADLQEKVEGGYVDEATAKELARARSNAQRSENQLRTQGEMTARERETRQREALKGQIQSSLTTWETSWKGADPDYKAKVSFVKREIKALVAEKGFPKSVDEAVKLANEAKENVEAEMKGLLPQKRQIEPVTGTTAGTAKAAPTTLQGAIDAALSG